MKMNKLLMTLGVTGTTIAPLATVVACSEDTTPKAEAISVTAGTIRDNVRLWNANMDDFTFDGSTADGSFAPVYWPVEDGVAIAEFSMVQNYLLAYPGLEVTLDWAEDEQPGVDTKKFGTGLTIVMKALDGNTIEFDETNTDADDAGTGVLSADAKTLTFTATELDVLNMWRESYMQYYNNWGVFNKNEDFRGTMDRFDRTVRHSTAEEIIYSAADMTGIWEETVRGERTDAWVSYDETEISNDIFEAAANYANAVTENDDDVLGFAHPQNVNTPYEYANRAIMTMDGGPVPDADRLTLVMNNFGSNYQSAGHIYIINESQWGVLPNEIIMDAGNTEDNKYLKAVEGQTNYAAALKMVQDDDLNDHAALMLMAGNVDIDEQELMIATGMAYGTIDADRSTLLAQSIREQTETVLGQTVDKYNSVSIAGRSHGMHATLDAIFSGTMQDKFLENVDYAFPEKNAMFPTITQGGRTGYRPTSALYAYTGSDTDYSGKLRDDMFTDYEMQWEPSLENFNETSDAQDSGYTYVQGDYADRHSDAQWSFYNAVEDQDAWRWFNFDGTTTDGTLHNDNVAAMTRRFSRAIYGYMDRFEAAIVDDADSELADFLLNNLYIETAQRDPNIGSIWQEEIDWALDLGLNYETRDEKPNLWWFNNEDDNAARGQHHDQAPSWDLHPIFGSTSGQ